MADDNNAQVITVYLDAAGIPAQFMTRLARRLVTDKLAATSTVYERKDPDSGVRSLVKLHTQPRHLRTISTRALCVDSVRAYPLECHDDYRAWVLRETA